MKIRLESGRHGWEGVSNGGEIGAKFNEEKSMQDDIDEINALLEGINLDGLETEEAEDSDEEIDKIIGDISKDLEGKIGDNSSYARRRLKERAGLLESPEISEETRKVIEDTETDEMQKLMAELKDLIGGAFG